MKSKISILEKSIEVLPEFEKSKFITELSEFERAHNIFNKQRAELVKQYDLIQRQINKGHFLKEPVLKEHQALIDMINKTYYAEVRFTFDFYKNFFGFERAEEITRGFYKGSEEFAIKHLAEFKNSFHGTREHYEKINFYLDKIFTEG